MQLTLWNKTAISWCTEFMHEKVPACLSESHFKNFLLSEITFFLVFDLCTTFVWRISEWMQESENNIHQKQRVQFKDQDFIAGNSGIIEITSCNWFHRKTLPDLRKKDLRALQNRPKDGPSVKSALCPGGKWKIRGFFWSFIWHGKRAENTQKYPMMF